MGRLPDSLWSWRKMPRSSEDIDLRVRQIVEEHRLLVKVICRE